MNYDVIIVGGGPAGIATAIHIKNLALQHKQDISVVILDKASTIGANAISGCILETQALKQLLPNFNELNLPINTQVTSESLEFLTKNHAVKLPHLTRWGNAGNYIISLSKLCSALALYAESLGIEVYPSVAVSDVIIQDGIVVGIKTLDSGVLSDGSHGPDYQEGFELFGRQIILAEGARGSVTKKIIKQFALDKDCAAQTYGLGIKEIWQIDAKEHMPGTIKHYLGYPLYNEAYGGGFLYYLEDNLVSVGLVTALDYKNPYLDPYEEFQKFKSHPQIKNVLSSGKRLEYGARVIVEGGIQSLINPEFPGGVIVGDALGLVNVAKIKGVNNAIWSGMIAAGSIYANLCANQSALKEGALKISYKDNLYNSELYQDLYKVRNVRPGFKYGLGLGLIHAGISYFTRGKLPYTLKHNGPDNKQLQQKTKHKKIIYPSPDNKITFRRDNSLAFSNLSYNEEQLCHLKLQDQKIPLTVNLRKFDLPETRYCPAGVYEFIPDNSESRIKLQINKANCLHCKACDIKDPEGNISWEAPEGGNGPQYSLM